MEKAKRERVTTAPTNNTMKNENFSQEEMAAISRKMERERDEARQLAEFWRNQSFETGSEAEWKAPLPWEK